MNLSFQIMRFGKKKRRIDVFHLRKPVEKGLAGMVMSNLFPQNVALVVDSRPTDNLEYSYMCLSRSAVTASVSVWMEADAFYGIKRGEPIARTALFHELGHYYFRHMKRSKEEMVAYDQAREAAVEIGQVIQQELDADQFAVDYLGKDYVISGLSDLKSLIEKALDQDSTDERNVAAIKELEYRIMKLQA